MTERIEYLTREGFTTIEKRLKYLKDVRRQEVAERLRLALEDGGELIENTEYEAAKNEQAFLEGEIIRLSQIVKNAHIIDDNVKSDTVVIGSRVTLVEKSTKEEEIYRLVGAPEANPSQGKISIESPLGKSLMGKAVGDKVTVSAPDGDLLFTVKSID